MKPGGVVKENGCTVCQCVNNVYICDDSSCQYNATTEKIELTTRPSYETTEKTEFTTEPFYQTSDKIELTTTTSRQTSVQNKFTTVEEPLSTTGLPKTSTERLSTVQWPEHTTLTPLSTFTTQQPGEEFTTKNGEKPTEGTVFVPTTVSPPIVLCDTHQ